MKKEAIIVTSKLSSQVLVRVLMITTVVAIVGIGSRALAKEPAANRAARRDWTLTGRELSQPPKKKEKFFQVVDHRLICESQSSEVPRGSKIRLLLGVERVEGNGRKLLNPFVDESFPDNVRIAVFDEFDRFVDFLPHMTQPEKKFERSKCELQLFEMRGRYVDISTKVTPSINDPFAITLEEGLYKFQLVACGKFFMGDSFEEGQTIPLTPTLEAAVDLEATRSKAAIVRISDAAKAPETPAESVDKIKLLSTLDVRKLTTKIGFDEEEKIEIFLTLSNLSRYDSLGVIAPFLRRGGDLEQPVRWVWHRPGVADWDFSRPGFGSRWPPSRSDFVILPPYGRARCRVMTLPVGTGDGEISVDLSQAVVISQEKIEILRSGDPEIGYRLGGVDPSVLDSKSVTKRKVVVE